jgi:peptidoglycan-associated lipoprotein
MQKHVPFYTVSLFLVAAFMTAGCAKQEVVRKDEGIAPKPVSTQALQANPDRTLSPQAVAPSDTQASVSVVPAQSTQKASSREGQQTALEKIYFNFDSATLSEDARGTLSKNAALLAKNPTSRIRIEGNCDERGSAEYNLALGERRAKAAHQYLVTLGIKPANLSIVSFGNEKPAVKSNDEAGWAKNRRDEFVFVAP